MRVLAVDPGTTTGVAVLVDRKILVSASMALPYDEMMATLSFWAAIVDVVLVETAPNFGDPEQTKLVGRMVRELRRENINVVTIPPGVWKPALKIHKKLAPPLTPRHQKDAVGMASWYINFRKKAEK